jgi:hypothetical protein
MRRRAVLVLGLSLGGRLVAGAESPSVAEVPRVQPCDYCPGHQSELLLHTDQKVATRMIHHNSYATRVR